MYVGSQKTTEVRTTPVNMETKENYELTEIKTLLRSIKPKTYKLDALSDKVIMYDGAENNRSEKKKYGLKIVGCQCII